MTQNDVVKRSKVLWLSHLCVFLSPLFFTVFILEREEYDNVKSMFLGQLGEYQTILFVIYTLIVFLLMYKGCLFYLKVKEFVALGESLSNESVVKYSVSLKGLLNGVVRMVKLSLVTVMPVYLSGVSYTYVTLLAAPSVLAFLSCYKVYYLKLVK